ncbi:MAG: tRNA lysidine(34) synthetase TilS [Planctomycetaceae bacterium]|jgi:tRNA(Ile)-lysidine synthase|nr:tRNA lysidine(34) synthetase TilS [Planctomycetaceae bacterium]
MLFFDQWFEYGLFLAVSGGADSSAMLHAAVKYARDKKLPVPIVGHVNHGLRGEESDDDELFVRSMAEEYGLLFFSHTVKKDEWKLDETGSVEAAAREIRYNFLINTATKNGCRYIATAHTADDQVETVLHRFIRGTGINGLSGMKSQRQLNYAVTLVRPMLYIKREEVIKYLKSIKKDFRFDSTNAESEFMRNRIRNELLPLLRSKFNSDVDNAILRLTTIASEINEIITDWFQLISKEIIVNMTEKEIILNRTKLIQMNKGAICEFFRRLWEIQGWSLRYMGYERWKELAEFSLKGKSSIQLPSLITAAVINKKNRIQENQFDQNDYLIIKNNQKNV